MKRRRHSAAQIASKLREADAALSNGSSIREVCRTLGISEATFHRWRKRCGPSTATAASGRTSLSPVLAATRIRDLEKENKRLKQLLAELTLEVSFLKDALAERDVTLTEE